MSFELIGACRPLFHLPARNLSALGTARALAAVDHYVGGTMYPLEDCTVTSVGFYTGTATSVDLTIRAEIVALDSSERPAGTVLANSSGIVNPTGSTYYTETLTSSYNLTAGTKYGVRVVCTARTGGSIGVYYTGASGGTNSLYLYNASYFPTVAYNIGTPTSQYDQQLTFDVNTTEGFTPKILGPYACLVGTTGSNPTGTTAGNCIGNKFTIASPTYIIGYQWYADLDAATIALFSGTDNTAMTGSTATITAANRSGTGEAGGFTFLDGPPLYLPAGTYRVAVKNTSTTQNNVRKASFGVATPVDNVSRIASNIMYTAYSSGAWTDTNTSLACLTPLIGYTPNDAPVPGYILGI